MSRLRVGPDDHADAAGKHLKDAVCLRENDRFDGAGYLSGYVVECALKAVILHDQSYDPVTTTHDKAKLQTWHGILRKKYGHDLRMLAAFAVGADGMRYFPELATYTTTSGDPAVFEWCETLRYAPPGVVGSGRCEAYVEWASLVYEHSIARMRLDGVL